jgi:hypothetical protein
LPLAKAPAAFGQLPLESAPHLLVGHTPSFEKQGELASGLPPPLVLRI